VAQSFIQKSCLFRRQFVKSREVSMVSHRINPSSMYDSLCFKFSHGALDTQNGVVYVAGQVAFDQNHMIVGGDDLGAQARQALANLRKVLDEAGSGVEELLRLRTYIVDHDHDKLVTVGRELGSF
jgi:enamine deaminase RidA (YjgF/YER057c/UK114 family)